MVSETLAHPSQDATHLAFCMDKGKQLADNQQQRKRKQAVEADNKDVIEVCNGSFMADVMHIEQWDRYISLNPTDDYQGRVMNIEEHFGNLPIASASPSNGWIRAYLKQTRSFLRNIKGLSL